MFRQHNSQCEPEDGETLTLYRNLRTGALEVTFSEALETDALSLFEDAATAATAQTPRRFRHKKRGTTYELLGEARYCRTEKPPLDGAVVSVYRVEGELRVYCCGQHGVAGAWLGTAGYQLSSSRVPEDGDTMCVYRSTDAGRLYVRAAEEFHDGRFEEVADDQGIGTAP